MQFRVFPAKADKTPCLSAWQQEATTDQNKLKLWSELYKGQLAYWAIPTGNGLIVLDVDVKDGGLETLKTLQLPLTMCQKTQSGGYHFFFKYYVNGRRYGNRVKFKPGLDIRCEGGYVLYYGTDQTPIADAPAWLLDEAAGKSFDHNPAQLVKVTPTIAEKTIESALENIRHAPQGERNNTLNVEAFRIGQLVTSQSVTKEYAFNVLLQAAQDCGLTGHEARATIASALEGSSKKPLTSPFESAPPQPTISLPPPPEAPARWTPKYFTKEEIMDMSKLRKPQLFQDWSTEDIAITTADGGTGKTTLKLFEAVCLALGERFLGFPNLQKGKTLFITGEDSTQKIGARIGAIVKHMNLPDDKIDTVLKSIVVKKDADLCLINKDRLGFLHPNQEALRKVLEAVEDIQPKMIVFDPIAAFWGSEAALNDMAKAVSKFVGELVERSGACVEMINHMGKASSAAKDMTQFAGRGGTGLPSHARVSRVLREVGDEEYIDLTGEALGEDQSAMMCNINKFSDGSSLYNKPFLILRDGFLFQRKAISAAKEIELESEMSDTERVFTFIKDERRLNRFPTEKIIIGHFNTCGDPLSKARVQQAISMLQYQGHMGERIRLIENPDATIRDKAFTITDIEGREL